MLSTATLSKSDAAMIAVLLACAAATIIESHHRIVIDPTANIERAVSGPVVQADFASTPTCEPTPTLDLSAP